MNRTFVKNISVDCAIFGFDSNKLKVLLVERTLKSDLNNTIFSDLTLTGYHIYEDENLDQAAARIVKDLTGLENLTLEQFYAFGDLDRLNHPNDQKWLEQFGDVFSKRVVTVGYYSLLPNCHIKLPEIDKKVAWYNVNEVENLAYDHKDILNKALEHLRYKLRYEPIGFELLSPKFTLSEMQALYEAIIGIKFDKRNFRKKVAQMKYVVPLDEKQKGVAHKPAQLFKFDKDIYLETRRERYDFFV